MLILVFFAWLAGVVTVLSPCILPVLPLILSSSVGGIETGKSRPLGVVMGFVLSFTLFTLFLSTIVRWSGISADTLRLVSVVVIGLFGFSLLVPALQIWMEGFFSRLTGIVPRSTGRQGLSGGIVVGLSLGLLWTPCVGPILASVISLALSGSVTLAAFFITFAYALGTAIPMLLIMWGGRTLLQRVPWLLRNTGNIQKAFGGLMILTALAVFTNLDRKFQSWIIRVFPKYGSGLTKFEDQSSIQKALKGIQNPPVSDGMKKEGQGKPMFDLLPRGPEAPELISGGAWINNVPLTLASLKGKVVVVDFWTYSCINCQRTLPYLKKWYEKYNSKGLVIIGVHAPEFEFEKSEKNVRQAVQDFGIKYPVVQDNNFSTWRAYDNHYWPAKYFIDKDGAIRYTHFGEGGYDESERVIQALLGETGAEGVDQAVENPEYQNYAGTPETYLGYERLDRFASPEQVRHDGPATYSVPTSLGRNQLAYSGEWTVMSEYVKPSKGAQLQIDFSAKEVYLVMRPKTEGVFGEVRVLIDGSIQSPGEDVSNGLVTVTADRLYRLVKLANPGRHTLTIEFLDSNTEVYAFTFG